MCVRLRRGVTCLLYDNKRGTCTHHISDACVLMAGNFRHQTNSSKYTLCGIVLEFDFPLPSLFGDLIGGTYRACSSTHSTPVRRHSEATRSTVFVWVAGAKCSHRVPKKINDRFGNVRPDCSQNPLEQLILIL